MTLVFTTLSASVDGYVSGRGARAGNAVVSGRNTYEHAGRWGGDSMVAGAPLFVVSRDPIPDAAPGQPIVTDGIESAIAQAKDVAEKAGRTSRSLPAPPQPKP
ncbi:hypothetical protein CLV30_1156 [Haloactinopolyspora alba]|uniref:RibD domain-containing protein n=1 Tax=Haloactinopolyspora alba TaxID=648780 RepID=A0A2P8DV47_9ACTN|nr:hypothetical protein [Haloactinopolyspora alba]PSL01071.1 hypothetical protein CLV30_1156 [Haloactinopolyspora alba]